MYEWCMTEKWDASNPVHKKIAHDIELGDGIPEMRSIDRCRQAIKTVGYEIVHEEDLADRGESVIILALIFDVGYWWSMTVAWQWGPLVLLFDRKFENGTNLVGSRYSVRPSPLPRSRNLRWPGDSDRCTAGGWLDGDVDWLEKVFGYSRSSVSFPKVPGTFKRLSRSLPMLLSCVFQPRLSSSRTGELTFDDLRPELNKTFSLPWCSSSARSPRTRTTKPLSLYPLSPLDTPSLH